MKYEEIPSDDTIQKTADALNAHNFHTEIVENGEEAKKKVLELVPEGADVQLNTSITLETIGINDIIDKSGKYNSHRAKIFTLDMQKDDEQIRILRSVADYALGSAHAVTQDGKLMIASNSGSNLPTYEYGAKHVVFVIGAQKIVENMDEGFKRIYEHSLPLESKRARKAYGLPDTWNSTPAKILIYNTDTSPVNPNRVHVILVKEVLGF